MLDSPTEKESKPPLGSVRQAIVNGEKNQPCHHVVIVRTKKENMKLTNTQDK